MAIIQPPLDDLDRIATPIHPAHVEVAGALAQLDDGWTVYVSPRVGLEHPHVLALHDRYGVCSIVVADWDESTHRSVPDGLVERDEHGSWRRIVDPRHVAARQRRTIFDRCFALPGDPVEPNEVVRAVVVLPGLTDGAARQVWGEHAVRPAERQIAVWGGERLHHQPEAILRGEGCPLPNAVNMQRLRSNITAAGRRDGAGGPLVLTAGQTELSYNAAEVSMRRARGPAGSGKSVGVAARAARLAASNHRVLAVCFSVTNASLLRRLVDERCGEVGADPTLVTCANFHSFCERVVDDGRGLGIESVMTPGMRLPDSIVAGAMHVFGTGYERRYDAVLVDEGQDFSPGWWNLLRDHVVEPGGEMLLVADALQDLYERRTWLADAPMAAAGFGEPWIELAGSQRMPDDATRVANEFARNNVFGDPLPDDIFATEQDVPADGHGGTDTIRSWQNVPETSNVGRAIGREVVRLLEEHPQLAPGDVVFLCEHHHDGEDAVAEIEAAGYAVHHLFSRDPDAPRRNRRYRLWPRADAVTGCTVHSFKGWGARAVVFGVGTETRSKRAAYVSLTRVARDPGGGPSFLSVVNADRRVDDFEPVFTATGSPLAAPAVVPDWAPPRAELRVG